MSTQNLCPMLSATDTHEHGWIVDSRHVTSEGTILYVKCAECQARRVDMQPRPSTPPHAVSAVIDSP
jgi:hypothetical protein